MTALLPQDESHTPLRILGVSSTNFEDGLAELTDRQGAIAVASQTYSTDMRVRRVVGQALCESNAEITLWDDISMGVEGTVVEYRLSAAALAFKTQAMAALFPGRPAETTETFVQGITVLRREQPRRTDQRGVKTCAQ